MSIIYATKADNIVIIKDKREILILSPKLYWFKRSPIVIKSTKKANSLANSILKDRPAKFNTIKTIRYQNDFYFFAYDGKELDNIIKENEIKNSKVYFAQTIFENTTKPLFFSDNSAVISIENSVAQIKMQPEAHDIDSFSQYLQNFRYKNDYFYYDVSSEQEEKTNKSAKMLLIATLLLAFISFGMDFLNLQKKSEILDKNIEAVSFDGKSSYVAKSLIKKWQKDEEDKQKRNKELHDLLNSKKDAQTIIYKNQKWETF